MVKLITWNIAHRQNAWYRLLDIDAEIAMLQEANEPPSEVAQRVETDSVPWRTSGDGVDRHWRTAIVKLSTRITVQWLETKQLNSARSDRLAVSRPGTMAAAKLTLPSGETLVVVSMYALWERPHCSTGSSWIYADASVHRLVSDLSALIGQQAGNRIIAAGDLNILYGYGEGGSGYWASRYSTVFSRMSALGLAFVGPQAPAGIQASPWPDELPPASLNVPTYYTSHQTPISATRQLDFVFASADLAKRVSVTALNEPDYWGPSDHCCVKIDISE